HAGALRGPFGVRFVIAEEGDLPQGVAERLSEQLDLDRVPAGGLTIFRNAAALPTAFVSPNAPVPDRSAPAAVEPSPTVIARELGGAGASFTGTADAPGHVVVTQQLDAGWRGGDARGGTAALPRYGVV